MTTGNFRRGQVLNVKDVKYNRFYEAKIVKVDEDQQELKVHYIGWNQRYDEVIPISSVRIRGAQREAASVAVDGDGFTCEEPLNVNSASCGSGMDGVQDEVETSPGWLGGGGERCSSEAAMGNVCGFCLRSLSRVSIICSGCGKGFHPDTLCVGVEKEVVSVLLKDKVGAINYCCCECRMVPTKGQGAGDVTAGYAQLLRVVGCLVNQVRSLLDSRSDTESENGTALNIPAKVSSDVNFSRDAIFTEVREVTERDKRKCSVILRGFNCESETAVREKFRSICQVLNVGHIELSDVRQIGNRRLFRAKILNDDKRKELLLVAKKLKALKEYEKMYIQKDLTFRQRQELYERRHRGSGLQGECKKMKEGVTEGSIRNGITQHVDYSLVQEKDLNGNTSRGRGRGRGRGVGREKRLGVVRGARGGQVSGEETGSGQGLVENNSVIDSSLFASVPHVRNGHLN